MSAIVNAAAEGDLEAIGTDGCSSGPIEVNVAAEGDLEAIGTDGWTSGPIELNAEGDSRVIGSDGWTSGPIELNVATEGEFEAIAGDGCTGHVEVRASLRLRFLGKWSIIGEMVYIAKKVGARTIQNQQGSSIFVKEETTNLNMEGKTVSWTRLWGSASSATSIGGVVPRIECDVMMRPIITSIRSEESAKSHGINKWSNKNVPLLNWFITMRRMFIAKIPHSHAKFSPPRYHKNHAF